MDQGTMDQGTMEQGTMECQPQRALCACILPLVHIGRREGALGKGLGTLHYILEETFLWTALIQRAHLNQTRIHLIQAGSLESEQDPSDSSGLT